MLEPDAERFQSDAGALFRDRHAEVVEHVAALLPWVLAA